MLKRDGYYRLADRLPHVVAAELVRRYALADELKLSTSVGSPEGWLFRHVRAKWSGEKRAPLKGEWYLSGAEIHAYRAANDLTTEYHIARIVVVREKTVTITEELGQL